MPGLNYKTEYSNRGIIRDNHCALLGIGGTVWKIPLSPAARRETDLEKKMILLVAEDFHFAAYLPAYKFFLYTIRTPKLESLASFPEKEEFIKKYFSAAFRGFESWPQVSLARLGEFSHFENFLKKFTRENPMLWKEALNKITVRKSSAHGDLHIDHMLRFGERPYFIDWALYNPNSSRYFDLINFWIFSEKLAGESWTEVWKKNLTQQPEVLYGVRISSTEYLAYAIWKIAADLKLLSIRNRLDARKQKKYESFINYLEKFLKESKTCPVIQLPECPL